MITRLEGVGRDGNFMLATAEARVCGLCIFKYSCIYWTMHLYFTPLYCGTIANGGLLFRRGGAARGKPAAPPARRPGSPPLTPRAARPELREPVPPQIAAIRSRPLAPSPPLDAVDPAAVRRVRRLCRQGLCHF